MVMAGSGHDKYVQYFRCGYYFPFLILMGDFSIETKERQLKAISSAPMGTGW